MAIFLIISLVSIIVYEFAFLVYGGILAKKNGKKVQPVSQVKRNARMHVLVIGDSTSLGVGANSPKNSLVGRFIAQYPYAHVDNFSENSMTLKRLCEKLIFCVRQEVIYDFVFIHIGGMDILLLSSFSKIAYYLQKVCGYALRLVCDGDGRRVIVVSANNVGSLPVFRFPLSTFYTRRSRKVCELYHNVCSENHVTHVPLFEEPNKDIFIKHSRVLFANDGIHPNDEGYGFWFIKIMGITSKVIR